MKIGLDLSVIQTPHRMRGVGATAINFINNIPESHRKNTFILFLYSEDQQEALSILNLDNLDYEIRNLQQPNKINIKLPGKLRRLNGILNRVKEVFETFGGDNRIKAKDLEDLTTFIQFDQMQILPKNKRLKTSVILYDLIPYIMETDYLWTYQTARRNGNSRKGALRKELLRRQYLNKVKSVCKSADDLIAISHHTKKDFIKYAGAKGSKIRVVHLGINPVASSSKSETVSFEEFKPNSWGYYKKPVDLNKKPFLLFVGGADPRRKLIDLVGAYNNLKAQGHDIKLVFAGDTMKGAHAIPVADVQQYIASSSYLDDIAFLGFVTDEQREWLYKNTLAFVYPSVYEGFGLPVLEAMQYGTPVITYKNSSIHEIAEDAVTYASDALSIMEACTSIMNAKKQPINNHVQQAQKFSWSKTTDSILSRV